MEETMHLPQVKTLGLDDNRLPASCCNIDEEVAVGCRPDFGHVLEMYLVQTMKGLYDEQCGG